MRWTETGISTPVDATNSISQIRRGHGINSTNPCRMIQDNITALNWLLLIVFSYQNFYLVPLAFIIDVFLNCKTCFITSELFWHAKTYLVNWHQEVGIGLTLSMYFKKSSIFHQVLGPFRLVPWREINLDLNDIGPGGMRKGMPLIFCWNVDFANHTSTHHLALTWFQCHLLIVSYKTGKYLSASNNYLMVTTLNIDYIPIQSSSILQKIHRNWSKTGMNYHLASEMTNRGTFKTCQNKFS